MGSCCFVIDVLHVAFTGDTLFDNTVGRTDFPGGSEEEMKQSIQKLKKLFDGNEKRVIYPRHGKSALGVDAIVAAEAVLGMQ